MKKKRSYSVGKPSSEEVRYFKPTDEEKNLKLEDPKYPLMHKLKKNYRVYLRVRSQQKLIS